MQEFFQELKRRKVYRVAVTYVVAAFVVLQLADLAAGAFGFPGWFEPMVWVVAGLGFPIALVLAWAFELTPMGVRRTPEAETSEEGSEPAEDRRSRSRLALQALVGLGLVAAAVAGGWYLTGGGGEPSAETAAPADTAQTEPRLGDRSIAVLPFEPLGQAEPDAFTEGMHDDLLARLSNVSDLKVISRKAVQQYRKSDKLTGEIARELGVRWVLEGGVQEMGDQIQVNAELIDPRTETYTWADQYRRALTTADLFDIQSEITERIVTSLEAELTPEETERVERRPTEDLEAYRLYVRGRTLLDRRTEEGMHQAVDYFRRAIERDSGFALAWSGLADARLLLPLYSFLDSPDARYEALMPAIPLAKADARRALELDPDLAEAHTSLGYAYVTNMEGPDALTQLQRAVELGPSYSEAHYWLGALLLALGQSEAALRHLELGVELNPENRIAPVWLNSALLANDRYEEALAQARQRNDPGDEAEALVHLNRWGAVRKTARMALERNGANPGLNAYLGLADVAEGDTASARRRLAGMGRGSELASPIPPALLHASLEEYDAATAVLGRVFKEREDLPPPHLAVDLGYYKLRYHYPDVLDPLRNDPRFERLIREANRAWGLNPDGSLPDSVDVSFRSQSEG